jgi:hypothetical protein
MFMKRLLSLFALTLIVLVGVAPAALADHCHRCSSGGTKCLPAFGSGGAMWCDDITTPGTCVLTGWCTGPHPLIEAEDPLGAEFIVASVERIDEPRPTANSESQVASLETPPAANR